MARISWGDDDFAPPRSEGANAQIVDRSVGGSQQSERGVRKAGHPFALTCGPATDSTYCVTVSFAVEVNCVVPLVYVAVRMGVSPSCAPDPAVTVSGVTF